MVDFKLALVTLFLPFLIYLHLFFDESRDYIKIFGYEYQHKFHDNETFSWYVISNLISLLILLLIFNCNRGRWRFFLIPIIIDFFTTIIVAFSEYQGYIDFFFSPLNIIGNIIFIIFILRLNYQIKGKIENQHILIPSDLILNEMLSSWNYKYNRHLNRLIKDKSKFSVKDYLSRIYFLIELINEKYRENDFGSSFKASFEKRKNYEIILSLITLIICLFIWTTLFRLNGKA